MCRSLLTFREGRRGGGEESSLSLHPSPFFRMVEEEVDEEGSRRRKRKMTKCMACKEVEKKKKERGTHQMCPAKVGEVGN